ncbi:MAG: tetratricopeptide repeat protein [Planctomycetes bacterium]|nr:tetratricopeptide repeat protein [Planctomycetota bacterium]
MDVDELLQEGLSKHRDGDVAGAARIYGEILQLDPIHPAANLNLASIALDQDQLHEARNLLTTVLAHDEDNGVAHLLYSRVCFLQGDHETGYPHISAAFEQLPEEEGVAAEFVSAMRRKYFTFEQEDYLQLFEAAQQGSLADERLQRLAHLTFMRIMRPELIRLVVEPGLPVDTPDAITRWLEELPEDSRPELALLARNFAQAVELVRSNPRYEPQRATLQLRVLPDEAGPETRSCELLEDADSLTGATIEIVRNSELQFIPFSEIRSIEFAQPAPATGVLIELREGEPISGLMPLFYLFTEFAEAENVRQGRSTLIRPLIADIAAGVGLRALRVDGEPLPIVRIEKIEFED